MAEPLLVEILTEELPPQALGRLGQAFAAGIHDGLVQSGLAPPDGSGWRAFATPRRLAIFVSAVSVKGNDRSTEVAGPSVSAPASAAAGFARKHGLEVGALEQRDTPKGKIYAAKVRIAGVELDAALAGIVGAALQKLPIPKVMRWGAGEAQFVRPVHGLVMLHGARVVPGTVLGLESGNCTKGHRFMGAGRISLGSAAEYENKLLEEGLVIADFEKRKSEIERQLLAAAKKQKARLGDYQGLLDEVTALVEHPSVYAGAFDASFLDVPQECLILTMRQNQKYFPLFDAGGKLLPKFLIVSNMQVAEPRRIVGGNQRVVRARLEDARFFFNQDRKTSLVDRVPQLSKVVYHNKLGTQLDRVRRLVDLSGKIATWLGADASQARRAAELSKADLLTGMVGEFPELQGVMGRYYALHDGEPREVADAIEAHYRPRFAGDRLPDGSVAAAVALADKLATLAGIFSTGQIPTGEKDPFALRRAALGVVRIIVEKELPLSIGNLCNAAFEPYGSKPPGELVEFVNERFAGYLKDLGYSTLQVDAVLSRNPTRPSLVPRQLEAVKAFLALPEADSLAAANKRIVNILRQAEAKGESFANAELGALREPAERALHAAVRSTSEKAKALFDRGDYAGYLTTFAVLKAPVDAFFDSVMVMAEDPVLRRSRLALLHELREAMNRIADIARLAK